MCILRMYAMCTAMLMMLFYNMVVYIMNSDQNKTINKNLVGILVVSFFDVPHSLLHDPYGRIDNTGRMCYLDV